MALHAHNSDHNSDHNDNEDKSDIDLHDMFDENGIPKTNVADMFDPDTLAKVGQSVLNGYEADKDSMDKWSEMVEFGLALVEQETHTKSIPWDGASNFKSPELMKAALKFSDRASTELLRGYNILKTKVIGDDPGEEKFKRGERVSEFQNWQLNVEMKEWRDEHEKLLYDLPYVGTVFKKTFFDAQLGRNASKLICYPNFTVNNNVDSLEKLRRFSEMHEFSANDVKSKILMNIWLDAEFDLGIKNDDDDDDGTEAEQDQLTNFIEQDGWYDLDDDGLEEPYTFIVQESNGIVARIMPRFEPNDIIANEKGEILRVNAIDNITKYGFVRDPQGGFLDVGYTHLLAALVSATNATTNQLVDAGTLANVGGGWLAKGFRKKMGAFRFKIGEWMQTGISAQDMHNGILPAPTKEPSPTLFSLMQFMIGSTQELAASADLKGALGANAPVGTTLALIDEQMQGTGAIVSRIYRAMSSEFKKLFVLNSKYVDPVQYQNVLDNPEANFEQDFNLQGMDIIPTANPEISTKTQRIIMAEAELSQVQTLLMMGKDPTAIVKNFFETIGSNITDELFPEETPEEQLQKLLSFNPELEALITGEQERQDLLAASQADALERLQAREDADLASNLDKRASEVTLNQAKTQKTLEEAETEDLKNDIALQIAAGDIDAKALQNQLSAKELINNDNI